MTPKDRVAAHLQIAWSEGALVFLHDCQRPLCEHLTKAWGLTLLNGMS
jgi:hypothetical protein